MASFADAIEPQQDLGGAVSFPIGYQVEEAGQTYLYGMPVMINGTDGGVQLWDGSTLTNGIAGISSQPAQNLGTTGSGAPGLPFGPITGAGSNIGSYAPPGDAAQPLAIITPPMVPISDGFAYYFIAGPTTVFRAKIGTSATVTPIATTNQMVGLLRGLTKDTGNNFWYVDNNKTSTNAVVQIVALDPLEAVGTVGGHVLFVFLPAAVQINA